MINGDGRNSNQTFSSDDDTLNVRSFSYNLFQMQFPPIKKVANANDHVKNIKKNPNAKIGGGGASGLGI